MKSMRHIVMRHIVVLLILVSGCMGQGQTAPPKTLRVKKDFQITVGWSYNFTNMISCMPPDSTGCLTSFSWGYIAGDGVTQIQLKISPLTICTGSTQPLTCTDSINAKLPIGSLTFYTTINYIDTTGHPGTVTTTTANPSLVSSPSPSNFTANKKKVY